MSETVSGGHTASAHPKLTRQQKAAAVIVSLGTDKASQLYQYMEPEDVEQLTLEVAQLGYLDSQTTEDVLNEYYQMCMTNKAVTEGGLEYAKAVLEKAFGQQTAASLLEKVTKSLKNREFAFLNKADEKSLYAALQHERPQTIALDIRQTSQGELHTDENGVAELAGFRETYSLHTDRAQAEVQLTAQP